MENKNTTKLIAVAIITLVIGALLGYTLAPTETTTVTETKTVEKIPLEGVTVTFGEITGASVQLEMMTPMFEEIIIPDLNEYAEKLGYDISFAILVDDANGQATIHQEKVQSFKAMDVNFLLGSGWSSHISASLSYCNENNMLLTSAGSTSPLLCLPDDNLFRLSIPDSENCKQYPILYKGLGIEAVLVMHLADAFGDGFYNMLAVETSKHGITIIDHVRYSDDVREFGNYLDQMNDIIGDAIETYGEGKVAVQCVSTQAQSMTLYSQVLDYPNLNKVIWFSTEFGGRDQMLVDNIGMPMVQLRCFSLLQTPSLSWKWLDFEERYFDATGLATDMYKANKYDISFIMASLILETQSLDPTDSIPLFIDKANDRYGVTGWCELDENGDRVPGLYNIWAFSELDGECWFQSYGTLNAIDQSVSWDPAAFASQDIDIPS